MRAGRLRHKATLQRWVETQEATGAPGGEWRDELQLWIGIEPVRGNERMALLQVQATTTHRIRARWSDKFAPEKRFLARGRVFHIQSVINIHERDSDAELMCVEQTS